MKQRNSNNVNIKVAAIPADAPTTKQQLLSLTTALLIITIILPVNVLAATATAPESNAQATQGVQAINNAAPFQAAQAEPSTDDTMQPAKNAITELSNQAINKVLQFHEAIQQEGSLTTSQKDQATRSLEDEMSQIRTATARVLDAKAADQATQAKDELLQQIQSTYLTLHGIKSSLIATKHDEMQSRLTLALTQLNYLANEMKEDTHMQDAPWEDINLALQNAEKAITLASVAIDDARNALNAKDLSAFDSAMKSSTGNLYDAMGNIQSVVTIIQSHMDSLELDESKPLTTTEAVNALL